MKGRIERVLCDIEREGETAIRKHVAFIRWLQSKHRRQLDRVVKAARIAGIGLDEFWWIVDLNHPRGCACWACIGRLQAWICRG